MLENQAAIKVLLVSSDQFTSMGLATLFSGNTKFTVSGSAKDHHEAVQLAHKLNPDVIILETDSEDIKDLDVIPALLQKCKAKISLLTKIQDDSILDHAVIKGARGILQKSEDPANLLKLVEKTHMGELWINRDTTSRILMAIAQANAPKEFTPEQVLVNTLTKKEDKIVWALHQNSELPLKEVAQKLFVSDHTLRNHLSSIYNKLNVRNRLELYVFFNNFIKNTMQ